MEECNIIEVKVFSFRLWRQMLIMEKCNTTDLCGNFFFTTSKPLKNIYRMISFKKKKFQFFIGLLFANSGKALQIGYISFRWL